MLCADRGLSYNLKDIDTSICSLKIEWGIGNCGGLFLINNFNFTLILFQSVFLSCIELFRIKP